MLPVGIPKNTAPRTHIANMTHAYLPMVPILVRQVVHAANANHVFVRCARNAVTLITDTGTVVALNSVAANAVAMPPMWKRLTARARNAGGMAVSGPVALVVLDWCAQAASVRLACLIAKARNADRTGAAGSVVRAIF